MAEHNDHFAPETVDEQLEQFRMLPHSEDVRLVNDLRTAYRSYSQKNAHSLEKVWSRIAQNQDAISSMLADINAAATYTREDRIKIYADYTPDRSKRGKMHTAVTTSAVFGIITALVASMIIVLNFVHITPITPDKAKISLQNEQSTIILASPTVNPVQSQPAIKDATGIYLIDALSFSDFEVEKLDLKSHALVWHYDIGGSGSNIIVKGNTVYLTTYTTSGVFVLALDTDTGKRIWNTNLSAETQAAPQMNFAYLSDVTIDNGSVYIMSEDGQVFALNATNGKQLWKYVSGNHFGDGNSRNPINAVTVANNTVYGGVHNTLFAINARNGHKLWSRQVADYLLLGKPQISGDSLYVSSSEEAQGTPGQSQRGFIFAFKASNGTQRWQYQAGNWILSNPVVVGNAIYFGSYDSNVYALNTSDGSVLWKYTTPGMIFHSPVFNNGILYVTPSGNGSPTQQNTVQPSILAFNATNGSLLWEKPIDADIAGINDGIIYASMFPRTMVGIDATTGNILWQEQYGNDLIDKYGLHSGPAPSITVIP